MNHQIKHSDLGIEKEIKEYFKRKYNWEMTDDDYQETAQSLYYLGKAIYRSLELENKQRVYNFSR